MKRTIEIYDTTLRDGAQGEGVSFTLEDKLAITRRLDDCGISCIEGGYPGSNPKDAEYFARAQKLKLSQATVVAFGMTARIGTRPSADKSLQLLLKAGTSTVTIVGKTWDFHVKHALRVSYKANLENIHTTMAFLKKRVDRVIFDAEHFFDGFKANPEYARACLEAAADGGADLLALCDTNGGSLPEQITRGLTAASKIEVPLGIHCHNDSGLATANTLAGVEAGAVQVQGTINGIGERCGNTNLCTVVPNLQLKMNRRCVSVAQLRKFTDLSHFVYEAGNVEPYRGDPFTGASAFAHKGGMHVSAVQRNPLTYEHIEPRLVGNGQRILVSELSGRSNVEAKAREFGLELEGRADELKQLLSEVKELESIGFQFEGADASFELLMRKSLKDKQQFFKLLGYRVLDDKPGESEPTIAEATVKIEGPDGKVEHTAATGDGPVNALDRALRKALVNFYPEIDDVQLHDYKVRVLDSADGTASMVRVFIESGDRESRWGTVGLSHNVVEASWQALVDAMVYKILKDKKRSRQRKRTSPAAK